MRRRQRTPAHAVLVQRFRQTDRRAGSRRQRKRESGLHQRLLFDGRLQRVERRMYSAQAVPAVQHRVHQPARRRPSRRHTGERPEQPGPHLPQRQRPRLPDRPARTVRLATGQRPRRIERAGKNHVRQAERRARIVRRPVQARLRPDREDADQRFDPRTPSGQSAADRRIRAF